ncbi:hypothetical protein GN956_G13113 [Arapaima gigas]
MGVFAMVTYVASVLPASRACSVRSHGARASQVGAVPGARPRAEPPPSRASPSAACRGCWPLPYYWGSACTQHYPGDKTADLSDPVLHTAAVNLHQTATQAADASAGIYESLSGTACSGRFRLSQTKSSKKRK